MTSTRRTLTVAIALLSASLRGSETIGHERERLPSRGARSLEPRASSFGLKLEARSSHLQVQPQGATAPNGAAMFRERCAECHGADAKGERGPDLTRLWTTP